MLSMDTTELTKLFNKGYYVALGTIAAVLETAQSSPKRTQVVREWQTNFASLLDELTTKGIATESEARSYVDNMVSQQVQTVDTTATTVNSAVVGDEISELENLTKQLADLRSELESLGQ